MASEQPVFIDVVDAVFSRLPESVARSYVADPAIYPPPPDDARIAIVMTLEDIARKLDTIDTSLSTLERKVEDGFSASQIRDEELRRLILLKNVVRQNLTKS